MLAVYSLHTKNPPTKSEKHNKTKPAEGARQAVASTNLMEKPATTAMDALRSAPAAANLPAPRLRGEEREGGQRVVQGERSLVVGSI
jgi:hypothetical protein